jgi:hypothetical protein
MSSGEEPLKLMLEVHFPGSEMLNEEHIAQRSSPGLPCQETRYWAPTGRTVYYNMVRWKTFIFNTYKSPGENDIFPALLQEDLQVIICLVMKIFRACIALGYVPLS